MSDFKDENIVDEATVSSSNAPKQTETTDVQTGAISRISRISSILTVLVGGLALFSDGYNAQVIGYMNPVFEVIYPKSFTASFKTRMSNAYLIGEIFGMLFFGWAIDKMGRRTGIVGATAFLILGVILATAAHGKTDDGMFWMMIIGRGVAGFGAGGESSLIPTRYPVIE
jgi:MFS family permease